MQEIKLGLEEIYRLLSKIGNPERDFKAIHVAGTNGKGSTTLMMASILSSAGIKTASFTSPHLLMERDCITIGGGRENGKVVSDSDYNAAREIVDDANKDDVHASRFEVLTATAFKVFSMLKVDIAVIEVGIGGTLDATNIIPPPLIAVICPIAIDHVAFLGDNVTEIAGHKAGIIKMGTMACVVAKQHHQDALDVIQRVATDKRVKLFEVRDHALEKTFSGSTLTCSQFTVEVKFPKDQVSQVHPALQGTYQLENIATVCKICNVLVDLGVCDIKPSALANGLATARNPGRLEWVTSIQYGRILLDGAHNEDGVKALAIQLQKERKKAASSLQILEEDVSVAFIVGFSGRKDSRHLLQLLGCRSGDSVLPVSFPQPEGMEWIFAMPPEEIGVTSAFYQNCNGDLVQALDMIDRKITQIVVVCGSLYLVAHFFRSIELEEGPPGLRKEIRIHQ